MSDASVWLTLRFQELVTQMQSAPEADLAVDLSLPVSADALARDLLRHAPPSPLEIERAIERVEDAVMPARARLPAALRLQTDDARLRALVGAAGAARADAPVWLDIDTVEQIFNRLVARAQGRPASQDPLPVDGPSAARLVIVRELLHHWRLDGLRLTA